MNAPDCTCQHVGYCDGSCTHPKPSLMELRVTDLRIALNDIIGLDHHWHGQEGRATEIARAALIRDDDLGAEGAVDVRQPDTSPTKQISEWMLGRSYVTGHGDTVADLLGELEAQIKERAAS